MHTEDQLSKIVILGTGSVGRALALTLIEDFIEGQGKQGTSILLPIPSVRDLPPIAVQVAHWAQVAGLPYHLIIADDQAQEQAKSAVLADLIEDAAESTAVSRPIQHAVLDLDPATDVVMVAWDDDDQTCEIAVRAACARRIKVLDLCAGLEQIDGLVGAPVAETPPAASTAAPSGPPWVSPELSETQAPAQADGEQAQTPTIGEVLDVFLDALALELVKRFARIIEE